VITLHCRPAGEGASEVRIAVGSARELEAWSRGRTTFCLADGAALQKSHALPPSWQLLSLAGGERLKTLANAESVLRRMAEASIDRTGRLVALGGGAVTDLGGLCASLYLRGIELWLVPTTLLAMVDSSVGGKNAVNLPAGKNLVGTVHPPALVVIDPGFLASLPEVEFHSGLGEVLKVGIGLDAELFAFLERERAAVLARNATAMATVIERCVAAKIRIVEADLRENGPRRLLNLGHTLGHALEAHSDYRKPHGLCVGRGLHFALRLGRAEGAIAAADAERAHRLLAAYGFAEDPLPSGAALMPFVARDKKVADGVLHFVLPTGVGRSETRALPLPRIAGLLAAGHPR
jgi:3-dehydroquinate synthase